MSQWSDPKSGCGERRLRLGHRHVDHVGQDRERGAGGRVDLHRRTRGLVRADALGCWPTTMPVMLPLVTTVTVYLYPSVVNSVSAPLSGSPTSCGTASVALGGRVATRRRGGAAHHQGHPGAGGDHHNQRDNKAQDRRVANALDHCVQQGCGPT